MQLTALGFLAVAGLLIIALIITARQLDGLSERSQQIVNQSATAMRASRVLIEQASSMERNARQYSIVGDEEILEVYADRRNRFGDAAEQIRSMMLNEQVLPLVDELVQTEASAYAAMSAGNAGDAVASLYSKLLDTARSISLLVDEWTAGEVKSIREETDDTRALLTLQAVLLVSAALILSVVFTALITRPLVQIEKAINHLGAGAYDTPIRINGPRDLSSLGGRLDWLRCRLGELEKQRSSFLRHVSHELKTPLASLQESAALLSDGVVGVLTPQQQEIMRIQSSNCKRLQSLIDDLLRHNAQSFSVLNTMPGPVRLDQVVENVLSVHELVIHSGSLTISKTLEDVTVSGDREQFRVVIDNLLTNAIKFSADNGEIRLLLKREASEAVFEIRDQGPGVPPDEVEKIFDAFYQGRSPARSTFKGSGLGLAIVQEYVAANGGHISVLDVPTGACFQLRYPLSA